MDRVNVSTFKSNEVKRAIYWEVFFFLHYVISRCVTTFKYYHEFSETFIAIQLIKQNKYQWANRLDSSTDLASKLVTTFCTEQTLLSLMKHKMGLKACHSTALFVAFRTLQSVSLLVKCLVQHKVWLEINEYRQLNFLMFWWRVLLAVAYYQVDAWVECLLRPRCSKK